MISYKLSEGSARLYRKFFTHRLAVLSLVCLKYLFCSFLNPWYRSMEKESNDAVTKKSYPATIHPTNEIEIILMILAI